jgi:hypothetical protein
MPLRKIVEVICLHRVKVQLAIDGRLTLWSPKNGCLTLWSPRCLLAPLNSSSVNSSTVRILLSESPQPYGQVIWHHDSKAGINLG